MMNEHDAMLRAAKDAPDDATSLGAFADMLDEHGRPGATLARAGMAHRQAGAPFPPSGTAEFEHLPLVPLGRGVGVHPMLVRDADPTGPARGPARVILGVTHVPDDVGNFGYASDMLYYHVPVNSRAHLVSLMADMEPSARSRLWRSLAPHLPREDAAHKLARLKAPAGGSVSGGLYQKGGQFLGRAFKRVRAVADALRKAAGGDPVEPAAPAKLARGGRRVPTAFANFTDARFEHVPAGYEPQALGRVVTLRELARIEKAYNVSARDSLAARRIQKGDDPDAPIQLPLKTITALVDRLARNSLRGHTLEAALRDPKNRTEDKLNYLSDHLIQQYRDYHARHGVSTDWYGAPVHELDRTLHGMFGPSPDAEPPAGHARLWSPDATVEHDPARNAPANVLFKALIAATSSSANPMDNVVHAYRIWRDGQRRGHDPVMSATLTNEKALADWLARNGNPPTQVKGGKKDPHDAGRWWYAHARKSVGAPGYSVFPAAVYANHDDPADPLNGMVYYTENSDKKRTYHMKSLRAHRDKLVKAELPNPENGELSPKGWTIRKQSVAANLKKIKAIVALGYRKFDETAAALAKSGVTMSSSPESRQASAYRFAAHWLLTPHRKGDWDAMNELTGRALPEWDAVKKEAMLTKDEPMEGAYMFGPKFGPFFLNMHGRLDPLTADKWWTRWWTLPQGSTRESPSGKADRMAMRYAAKRASDALGVHPAQFQADLWDDAQRAYRSLGGEGMESYTLADGARAMKAIHEKKPAAPSAEPAIPLARPKKPVAPAAPDRWEWARAASTAAADASADAPGGITGRPPSGALTHPVMPEWLASHHEETAEKHDRDADINRRLLARAQARNLPFTTGVWAKGVAAHEEAARAHRTAARLWRGEQPVAPSDDVTDQFYPEFHQLARQPFRAAYVSPNTGTGLSAREAVAQMKAAPAIPGARKGLGFWSDGAEASYVLGAADDESLAERAVELGRQLRQKAVLWFAESPSGPDVAHVVTVPSRNAQAIHDGMARHGIEYKTILPTKAGSVVHVIDQGNALAPQVNAWAQEAGATAHDTFAGTAVYRPLEGA